MEIPDIFLQALECATPEQRERFLDSACDGRSALRAEIEAMLQRAPRLDTYIERSAFTTPAAHEALLLSQTEVQTQLGSRFRLVSCLGEGGMGSVWLADQSHPIERQVAIKLLKPGFNSQKILARFETERQTLAKLQHPNIASIFDAGTAEDGRPFFVMEFCGGPNITEYSLSKTLGLRARLELFIMVCHAIAYVHQRGILHRDIKPSNVLVAEYNGLAVPKVIDFGIAKSVGQGLPKGTLGSTPWGLTGTPEYMAPELITGEPAIATKVSDIYSLGAMLYELLTGSPPFGTLRPDQAGLLAFVKRVDAADPVPPSRVVRQRLEDVPADSTPVPFPSPVLDEPLGELDWVVLRSLERDPNRRYQDVADLQADLQTFLAGQAVTAKAPGLIRRCTRWCRRNRLPAVAAALSIGTLLLMATLFRSATSRDAGSEMGLQRESLQASVAMHMDQGQKLLSSGKPQEALAAFDQAMGHLQELERIAPDDEQVQELILSALDQRPRIFLSIGQVEAAVAEMLKGQERIATIARTFPDRERAQSFRGLQHLNLGIAFFALRRAPEARNQLTQARAIFEELVNVYPSKHEHRERLAVTVNYLGANVASEGNVE